MIDNHYSVVGNFQHFIVTKTRFIRIYQYTCYNLFFCFFKSHENSMFVRNDFIWPKNRGLIPIGELFYDDPVKNDMISGYGGKNPVAFFNWDRES